MLGVWTSHPGQSHFSSGLGARLTSVPARDSRQHVDERLDLDADFVQVARAALAAGALQATPLLRRLARRYRETRPELAAALVGLLRETPARGGASALAPVMQPVDSESRITLVREEDPVVMTVEPVLLPQIRQALNQLVVEHGRPDRLLDAGLAPTRTALFIGPPGVGKTLAARSLAHDLARPLIVLDLASVMSSLLGRTGENVRRVLDYAQQRPCVLLLDEFDAVAKRRDDATEVGELKRLVTVLLQEIDTWPEGSLLLAATNHPELLDPAIWRRFEQVIDFPLPDETALSLAMREYLQDGTVPDGLIRSFAPLYAGASYSDLEREVMRARRMAVVQDLPIADSLLTVTRERLSRLPTARRVQFGTELVRRTGMSQRRAHELTGVSRDTLRKHLGGRDQDGAGDA